MYHILPNGLSLYQSDLEVSFTSVSIYGRTVGGGEMQTNVQSSIANQMLPDWK